MPVNLLPHSRANPLMVEDAEYDQLVQRKQGGWSRCTEETEWLAKLHYLRAGFEKDKLKQAQFEEREFRLVEGWLRKFTA